MRKGITIALVVLVLLAAIAPIASAQGKPIGSCRDGFELHPAMDHDDQHEHHHIGTETDQNGDGWICVKHVGVDENNHVHIDNQAALK
ncbi:MAG: hypothetical protein HZB51_10890 [Chloroflexi bacterium]|nr:hypothetical protein [Chloroflexota bacterium]